MRSLILRNIARGLLPVIVLFSVYLLLRGHNEPGGGFIAGLVTASATLLVALSFGVNWAREKLTPIIRPAFALGLLLAACSGMFAILMGDPFLTHYDFYLPLPGGTEVHLSTTLAFDIGVFLVVVSSVAVTMSIFAEAAE